jgi:hypothetical protein
MNIILKSSTESLILLAAILGIVVSFIGISFTLPRALGIPINYEWVRRDPFGLYFMCFMFLIITLTNFIVSRNASISLSQYLYLILLMSYQASLAAIAFARYPYRDVLLHGATVKYLLNEGSIPKETAEASWPFSYYLHALLSLFVNLDIEASNTLLFLTLSILTIITTVLMAKVILTMLRNSNFEFLLMLSLSLYYIQFNHYNSFLHYCRAQLASFLLLIIYYLILNVALLHRHVVRLIITIFILVVALFYTHPFYSVQFLGSLLFASLATSISKRQQHLKGTFISVSMISFILFFIINLIQSEFAYNIIYNNIISGLKSSIWEFTSGLIQVREELPLFGVIVRTIWKGVLLLLLFSSFTYLIFNYQYLKFPDFIFIGHALTTVTLFIIFLYIKGFTGRIISYIGIPLVYFSVSMLLTVMRNYSRSRVLIAGSMSISLIIFLLSNILVFFDPPISGRFVTSSISAALSFVFKEVTYTRIGSLQASPLHIIARFFDPEGNKVVVFQTLNQEHGLSIELVLANIDIDIKSLKNMLGSHSLIFNNGVVYGIS